MTSHAVSFVAVDQHVVLSRGIFASTADLARKLRRYDQGLCEAGQARFAGSTTTRRGLT